MYILTLLEPLKQQQNKTNKKNKYEYLMQMLW